MINEAFVGDDVSVQCVLVAIGGGSDRDQIAHKSSLLVNFDGPFSVGTARPAFQKRLTVAM